MFVNRRFSGFISRLPVAARWSLYILFGLGALSVLAPWISPDSTPDANQQDVRIRTLPPGRGVDFLIEARSTRNSNQSQSRLPLGWYESKPWGYRYVVWDQPYDTISVVSSAGQQMEVIHQTFWIGTDLMGRDLLSRLLLGMRITLKIGVFAVLVSLLVGIALGMLAGYYGGKVDQFLTWLMQVVWSVPSIMLVIAFSLALGRGAWQVYLAVGLTLWVDVARLVRGEARRLREQEFVQAAQVLGYGSTRIMMHHLLPNMLGPILIMAAAQFASAILVESGLSFLGLGIQPPAPSLGMMIREHYPYILTRSAWLAIAPGVVISLMVLTCNLLSTGMSDLLGRVEKKS
ncbi:MAG: ABC transporter permease [Bacteroidetes bacterium]|nr:ABC transporter permease [Bacteroidota bacterium]